MKHLYVIAALTLGLAACEKGDKKDQKAKSAVKDTPAADTSELWALAPKSAVVGFVVADGTLKNALAAANEIKRVVGLAPKGAEAIATMEAEISSDAPFNVLDPAAYSEAGLDLNKGAAFFMDDSEEVVAVFPVGNRAAFRKLAKDKAKTETVNGREFDRLDKAYCLEGKGRYVCAEKVELVDEALARGASPLGDKAKSLDASIRGDFELIALLDRIPNAKGELDDVAMALTNIKTGVLSARLSSGRFVVRGWAEGTPPGPVAEGLKSLPFDAKIREQGAGAVMAMLYRIPIEATGLMKEAPPTLPIPGTQVDARKDILDQLTGELAFYSVPAKNEYGFGLRYVIGMKDTAGLAKALPQLCTMGNAAPGLTLVSKEGSCTGNFDPSALGVAEVGKMLSPFPIAIELNEVGLVVSAGEVPKGGTLSAQAGGPVSKSMLEDKWNAVMWGRWADPLNAEGGIMGKIMEMAKGNAAPDQMEYIKIARLLMGHLFESGVAMKLDDKGAHLAIELTTMAADSAEVYSAYSKVLADGITKGTGYQEALAALGKKHKGSLAAKQADLGVTGAPSLAFTTGILAAVAIPAFVKYTKKSKTSEARVLINRIASGARAYHAAEGKLPASVPMTPPAGSCCKSRQKCAPDAQLWSQPTWTALQFSVDDPHYYSYEFKSLGTSYEVRAVGDLDCDGVFSTFTMQGDVKNPSGGFDPIRRENELE